MQNQIKQFLLLIIFIISSIKGYGQFEEKAIVSPPSPSAATFLQAAQTPVDGYTGTAQINAPLYTIETGKFTIPINLNYNTAGIKVQDYAGLVGLGWNLQAAGVISRTVRGLPDDDPDGYIGVNNRGAKVTSAYDSVYFNKIIDGKWDAEPDVYTFNFMGKSGRLFINTSKEALANSDYGVRVQTHPFQSTGGTKWVLYDLEGNQYVFGGDNSSVENVTTKLVRNDYGSDGNRFSGSVKKTLSEKTYASSWYLKQVISADLTDTIDFEYTVGSRYETSYIIDLQKNKYERNTIVPCTGNFLKESEKWFEETINSYNNPVYLKTIKTKNCKVDFRYANNRLDILNGGYLTDISISNSLGSFITGYSLMYDYFKSNENLNYKTENLQRLKLNSILQLFPEFRTLKCYSFSYNSAENLPSRFSEKFDHWGYYNNNDKGTVFLYKIMGDCRDTSWSIGSGNYLNTKYRPFLTTNKEVDFNKTQACVLNKMVNELGQVTRFEYEINTCNFFDDTKGIYKNINVGGLRVKKVTIEDAVGENTLTTSYTYQTADGKSSGVLITLPPIYTFGLRDYRTKPTIQELRTNFGQLPQTAYMSGDLMIPISFDQIMRNSIITGLIGGAYELITGMGNAPIDPNEFLYTIEPSIPYNNLFDINGNNVVYTMTTTISADGSKIQNFYSNPLDYADKTDLFDVDYLGYNLSTAKGSGAPFAPFTSRASLRGYPKETRFYNSNNSLLKSTIYKYKVQSKPQSLKGLRACVSGYIDTRYDLIVTYRLGTYNELYENLLLDSLIEESYSGSEKLTSIQTFVYNTDYPTLLKSESLTGSDKKAIKKDYYRVINKDEIGTEFSTEEKNVFTLLQNAKRLSPMIASVVSADGSKIEEKKLTYKQWTVSGKNYLLPEYSYIKSNNIWLPKLRLLSYDNKGNVLSQLKDNKLLTSSLWAYNNCYPVAISINAALQDIAFTSFETGEKGNWIYTGTPQESSLIPALTGKKIYDISGGAISKSGLTTSIEYILSYWTKNNNAFSISGTQAGYPIKVKTANGWNLYEHKLSGISSITVSGSGYIDELRLSPLEAELATYTYDPLMGITSITNKNGYINYYTYKDLKLSLVKDINGDIKNEYQYHYGPNYLNCTGEGKKFINGNCEQGNVINATSWVDNTTPGGATYYCKYYYQFPDGSITGPYTKGSSQYFPCNNVIE